MLWSQLDACWQLALLPVEQYTIQQIECYEIEPVKVDKAEATVYSMSGTKIRYILLHIRV